MLQLGAESYARILYPAGLTGTHTSILYPIHPSFTHRPPPRPPAPSSSLPVFYIWSETHTGWPYRAPYPHSLPRPTSLTHRTPSAQDCETSLRQSPAGIPEDSSAPRQSFVPNIERHNISCAAVFREDERLVTAEKAKKKKKDERKTHKMTLPSPAPHPSPHPKHAWKAELGPTRTTGKGDTPIVQHTAAPLHFPETRARCSYCHQTNAFYWSPSPSPHLRPHLPPPATVPSTFSCEQYTHGYRDCSSSSSGGGGGGGRGGG